SLRGIRWDYIATAALVLVVIVGGVLYLPRAMTTAARTSSSLAGTAGEAAKAAAKEAVTVAPVVTRRAITAAGRAIPRSNTGNAATNAKSPAAVQPDLPAAKPAD